MIEQGIYFALGCIITALIALAFAPLFWRRALRLTRRRLQLQVPLSMQEILAERDQIRAEFAVERLRIEQAMARIEETKAADMAEIGRRGVAATALADGLEKVRAIERTQKGEIADLDRRLAESDAESGTFAIALHDAFVRLAAATSAKDGFEAEAERLHDLSEDRRITVASLETRVIGLEMRLTDAQRAGVLREQSLTEEMTRRLESATALAAGHEANGVTLRGELDETGSKLRAVEAQLGERDNQIKMSDGIVRILRAEIAVLQDARAGDDNDKAAMGATSDALRRDLDDANGSIRAGQAALGERDAQIQANEGLVASLRAEIAALQVARDADARGGLAGHAASDAELRESIHALGLAVATMTREQRPRRLPADPRRKARDVQTSPADAG